VQFGIGDFKEFFRDNPNLFKIVPEYLALCTHIADRNIKYSAALPHCRLSMAKLKTLTIFILLTLACN
jgi:hypothetical protein